MKGLGVGVRVALGTPEEIEVVIRDSECLSQEKRWGHLGNATRIEMC